MNGFMTAFQVRNDLIREAFVLTGPTATPLELTIMIDLASESGLGSSGAITVALLHAMHLFKGESVTAEQLYREAAHIEVDVLEGASGYHDPTICALGGLKLIEYTGSHVHARDLEMSVRTRTDFETSLLFFYSGRYARSKPSLALLSSHLGEALTTLHDIIATRLPSREGVCGGRPHDHWNDHRRAAEPQGAPAGQLLGPVRPRHHRSGARVWRLLPVARRQDQRLRDRLRATGTARRRSERRFGPRGGRYQHRIQGQPCHYSLDPGRVSWTCSVSD